MTLLLSEIEPTAESAPKPKTAKISGIDASGGPPERLDLRGMRFEEAMAELEHYLDYAYRSGARVEVTIVHGLGTGAIREGTRKLLGQLPYVKTFRDGGVGHGGTGATIVEFER
jgi:DNA mismatch repair protein MutS2